MMKNNQKGFTIVEVLIVLLVIGLIGGATWYVLQSKDKKSPATNTSQSQQETIKTTDTEQSQSTEATTFASHVDITEWGIRVSFDDADKVTYKISTDDSGISYASLYLKDSVTSVESCRALGVGFGRDTKSRGADNNTKVGNYYYQLSGGPGACDGDPGGPSGSINQLRAKIVGQELGSQKYTVIAI